MNFLRFVIAVETLTRTFEALADSRIDRDKGFINDVCVVRVGEAKGHDVWVDNRSLESVVAIGNSNPEGVKVKLRHSAPGVFQSILEESFGLLKEFRIAGNKVVARLEMLKSLETNLKERAFEMAEKMASQFGLSIDFGGVFESIGDKKFLRCMQLKSVDLTDKPAATDGLFSMKEPQYEAGTSGKHKSDCMCAECDKAKLEAGGGKSGTHPLDTKMQAIEATLKTLTEAVSRLTSTPPASQFEERLKKAEQFAENSAAALALSQKDSIINRMSGESRVAIDPKTKVAYTIEQLRQFEVATLEILAANAQVIPTQARLTYTGNGTPPANKFLAKDGKTPLKGSALTETAWEEKYGDINTMIARSFGQS